MKITFKAEHAEIVDKIKTIDLNQIFSIIDFSPKDHEKKDNIMYAISLLNIYAEAYNNYENNFLEQPLPIQRK